jgi:hypothetical protein
VTVTSDCHSRLPYNGWSMDRDDVRAKIAKLQSGIAEARLTYERASEACEARLRAFLPKLLAIHNSISQTELLAPPRVAKGAAASAISPVDSDDHWHAYSEDNPNPCAIWAEPDIVITFNPFKDTWHYRQPFHRSGFVSEDDILNWYSDSIAEWVVYYYPGRKNEIEREERLRESENETDQESREGSWERRQRAELRQILINFGLVFLFIFVILYWFVENV